MQNRRVPLPGIILVLIVIGVGVYFGYQKLMNKSNGALTASGTIESVTVNVSPEMAGKVQEVLSSESQSVKAGDKLLTLDDSLLTAQKQVAQSGVQSAQQAQIRRASCRER